MILAKIKIVSSFEKAYVWKDTITIPPYLCLLEKTWSLIPTHYEMWGLFHKSFYYELCNTLPERTRKITS